MQPCVSVCVCVHVSLQNVCVRPCNRSIARTCTSAPHQKPMSGPIDVQMAVKTKGHTGGGSTSKKSSERAEDTSEVYTCTCTGTPLKPLPHLLAVVAANSGLLFGSEGACPGFCWPSTSAVAFVLGWSLSERFLRRLQATQGRPIVQLSKQMKRFESVAPPLFRHAHACICVQTCAHL